MTPQTSLPSLGLCVMYPSPGVIERIGGDWDWIWLDGQHGQIAGYDTMLAMIRACQYAGKPAYTRVPGHEASWIGLALDMGADAVIVPQVDTVEQAASAVRAAKFPPLGNRSFGGRRPIDLFGRGYCANPGRPKLVCQIESPEALEHCEEIAKLPGVDALFFGPDDYLLRLGVNLDASAGDASLSPAISRISAACRLWGKDLIVVGIGDEAFRMGLENEATHIVAGSDVGFLAGGSQRAAGRARGCIGKPAPDSALPSGKLY